LITFHYRIIFKIAVHSYHSILHHRCPSYLSDLVQFVTADSSRSQLRSSTIRTVCLRRYD